MSATGKGRSGRPGFTMVEMLITIALIGILATFVASLYAYARAKARALRCFHNQQQIARALVGFYSDKGRFPEDAPETDLALQLANYIPWPDAEHGTALPGVYLCPNDRRGRGFNSYQEFYIQRREPAEAGSFVLGCPRHDDARESWVNLFGACEGMRLRPGRVVINGAPVTAESSAAGRATNGGVLSFEDGSTVTATAGAANYAVTAVASFRRQDGRLYTIVRISGSGSAQFSVTPGSSFEVISPMALIGVEGTKFVVTTAGTGERVELTEGSARVWNRLTRQETLLRGSGSVQTDAPAAVSCLGCSAHCRAGAHCRRCPLHVGRPENIGSTSCVVCPQHCPPARPGRAHECHFCPLSRGGHN